MIVIEHLSKTYKGNVHALRDVTLELPATGMFGLLGVNGAGKTTLMRILAGVLEPTGGQAHAFGHDLRTGAGKQAVKALLGYLPQELGLYPKLTGREFLDYIAILKGVTGQAERRRQVDAALERVNLTDKAGQPLHAYSGGMKRRVGIAQALLGSPRLLIVDEPTAGLDPEERIRLRNLFGEVARECLVILSTHIVEDISHSCNDLAVLGGGQVLFRGAPRDLLGRARGHVWHITTSGERPNGGLTVISTLHLEEGVQYRVLGNPGEGYSAAPVEPSLEDGYMWLMRR